MACLEKKEKTVYTNVGLIGSATVGKTATLFAIGQRSNQKNVTPPPEATTVTIGFSTTELTLNGVSYRITDIGGQELFQNTLTHITSSIDIMVIVVDMSNPNTWNKIEDYMLNVFPRLSESNVRLKPDIKIIIVANKVDLITNVQEQTLEIQAIIDKTMAEMKERGTLPTLKMDFIQTSAIHNTNIDNLVDLLVKKSDEQRMGRNSTRQTNKCCG